MAFSREQLRLFVINHDGADGWVGRMTRQEISGRRSTTCSIQGGPEGVRSVVKSLMEAYMEQESLPRSIFVDVESLEPEIVKRRLGVLPFVIVEVAK